VSLADHYQIKRTSFKQQCTNLYGEDYGLLLHNFYRDYLYFGGAKDGGNLSLTKRRIKHMKSVTSVYGENKIKRIINDITDRIKKGKTGGTTVRPGYFDKVLVNSGKSKAQVKQQENIRGKGIPIPKVKTRTEYDDDFYNWDYTCPECKEDITPWDTECKNESCRTWFEWDKVDVPEC